MQHFGLAALTILELAGEDSGDTPSDDINQWIQAGIVLAVGLVLATAARALVRKVGNRDDTVTSTVQIMARLVFALFAAITVYVALKTIGLDLGPVLAGAGIAGIAVAFALQDIAENYISGVLMGFRNPFVPGDQIVSGDHEGTVEELNLRYTTLRSYDGVKILLPNAQVLKNPLVNLTTNGDRRTDFSIGVEYGTDLDHARQVAIDAVRSVGEVNDEPAPQAWVEELAGSWVNIRVRYWHSPRIADMWEVRNAAIVAVYKATADADIELPYERQIVEVTAGAKPVSVVRTEE